MKKGKRLKILVTAGATREYIDPVRFITNPATGILGCQIAKTAKKRGHQVRAIITTSVQPSLNNIKAMQVTDCAQLKRAIDKQFNWCDCLVMTAAVGDFRLKHKAPGKIKRKGKKKLLLRLAPNPDILQQLGLKKGKKLLVGFALETENLRSLAQAKLRQKNLDLIVATQADTRSYPFGPNLIKALILDRQGGILRLPRLKKRQLARILLDSIEKLMLS